MCYTHKWWRCDCCPGRTLMWSMELVVWRRWGYSTSLCNWGSVAIIHTCLKALNQVRGWGWKRGWGEGVGWGWGDRYISSGSFLNKKWTWILHHVFKFCCNFIHLFVHICWWLLPILVLITWMVKEIQALWVFNFPSIIATLQAHIFACLPLADSWVPGIWLKPLSVQLNDTIHFFKFLFVKGLTIKYVWNIDCKIWLTGQLKLNLLFSHCKGHCCCYCYSVENIVVVIVIP